MIHYFQKIMAAAYEPFAVFAVIGCVLLWRVISPAGRKTLIFCVGVGAAMVAWRVALQLTVSRYYAAIIVPVVIGVAFFIYHLPELVVRPLKLDAKVAAKVILCGRGVLLAACFFIGLGKCWHYNRYSDYISRAADVILERGGGNAKIWSLSEAKRLGYYTSAAVNPIYEDKLDCLRIELNRNLIYGETVYVNDFMDATSGFLSKADLSLHPRSGWEVVYESFVDSREKAKFVVYEYKPFVRLEPVAAPDTVGELEEVVYYQDFDLPPGSRAVVFLANLSTDRALKKSVFPTEFADNHSGRALLIEGDDDVRGAAQFNTWFPAGTYTFSCEARGEPGCVISLILNSSAGKTHVGNFTTAQFELPDDGVYRLLVGITPASLCGGDTFRPIVQVEKQRCVIDNARLTVHGTAAP